MRGLGDGRSGRRQSARTVNVLVAQREAAKQAGIVVGDEEGAYIKLFNLSSKVSANQVFGRMSTRVLPYLAALHIRERPIYLAGASEELRSS